MTLEFGLVRLLMVLGLFDLQVPNGFGSGLGAMQLILYAIYHKNRGSPKEAFSDEGKSLDMDEKERPDHRATENPNSNQLQEVLV